MPIQFVSPRPGAMYSSPSTFFVADMQYLDDVHFTRSYYLDRVCLIAIFAVDSDGTPMFVSYACEKQADAFVIENADEATRKLFRKYEGRVCAIDIFVRDYQGAFLRRGSKYNINDHAVVSLFPLNPSTEVIAGMPHGTYFVVEGAYSDFTAKSDDGATWSITTEDQTYLVEASSIEEPRFAGGVLEHLRNKAPIPGEQVHMTVYRNTKLDCLKSTHDMPYLMRPHPSRHATYSRLRTQIAILLRKVNSYLLRGQWRKARRLLAQIRFMECTVAEKQQVEDFYVKFPTQELPFWTPDAIYAKRFLRGFGINLERLTSDEVTAVARKVFNGRLTATEQSRHTDPIILLRHMMQQEGASTVQLASVIASGITGRFERLLQLRYPSAHDRRDLNCQVLENSLREACGYDNEALASAVVSFVDAYMSDSLSTGQRAMFEHSCDQAFKTIRYWQRQNYSAAQRITKAHTSL